MILVTIAVVASLSLAIYIWKYRFAIGARPLMVLCLTVAIWSFGYGQELRTAEVATAQFWAKIQYLGIVSLPVAWLYLALEYTGYTRWLKWHFLLAVSLIPIFTLLIIWLNDQWIWQSFNLVRADTYFIFRPTYGPWFWVHFVYTYFLLLIGTAIIAQTIINPFTPYRWQALSLLLALLFPWIGNALYIFGHSQIDITPFAFVISIFSLTWSVVGLKLLDIAPVARSLLIETMQDMVIVLDMQNRVIDLNEAACKVVHQEASQIIGQYASVVFSQWQQTFAQYKGVLEAQTIITLTTNNQQVCLDMTISPIEQQGQLLGRLFVFRNVTDYIRLNITHQETLLQLQARVHEIEKLHQISLDLVSTLNPAQVLRAVIIGSVNLLEAETGGLFLYRKEKDILELAECYPHHTLPQNYEIAPGEGLTGKIWLLNEPMLVNNYEEWNGRLPQLTTTIGHRSSIGVPIQYGEEKLGVLAVTAKAGRFYNQRDIDLLTLFVPSAALAIHNARLYEQLQIELAERTQTEQTLRQSEEWLRTFNSLIHSSLNSHDLQTMAQFLTDRLGDLFHADGCFITLWDEAQARPIPFAAYGTFRHTYSSTIPAAGETTMTESVLRLGQTLTAEDVFNSPYMSPHIAAQFSTRSMMGLPLIAGEQKLGAALISFERPHRFTDVEIKQGEQVAQIVALALARAQAYTAAQEEIAHRKQIERFLRESEEQLRQLALYDGLTGLPNRRLLMNQLNKAIQQRESNYFALLFLDLDRFKIINDNLGHQVGDALLVAIARLLESCVCSHDMVARLSGDEFVILLTEIEDEEEARRITEYILERMSQPFFLGGHTIHTSVSIGLLPHTAQYDDPDEMLRHADIAMYQAKLSGKSRYQVFNLSQQILTTDLWQIESDLRRALEQEELIVYYQPIVSLQNGRLTAVEALVRWQHPQRGLLEPSVFLPVAEEAGLIMAIDEWVLQHASKQLQKWHQDGHDPLRLMVNVSTMQLQQESATTFIHTALQQAGLSPHSLGLEITERFAARSKDYIPCLNTLHRQGITVLIDDFGIGSSLESLKQLSLDYLKINQTFVQGMTYSTYDQAIITAIIAMAHRLGLQVIAEGVETAEQLTYLQSEGCDEIQGYIVSPPLPAAEMTLWLKEKGKFILDIGSVDKSLDMTVRAHFAKHIGYALVDEQLSFLQSNATMHQWVSKDVTKLDGLLVTEVFPVLIGLEDAMFNLIHTPGAEPLILPRVHHPTTDEFGRYYDLRIEPFTIDTTVLLIIIQDVTREARQEFVLRQQLNQLRLEMTV